MYDGLNSTEYKGSNSQFYAENHVKAGKKLWRTANRRKKL